MKKRVTPEALADMLMKRVYVPFSAVVSAAADGEILSLCQFDTAFAGEQMAFDERAAEVWLLSHHPEGLREMTAEDAANLNRLRPARPTRASVFSSSGRIPAVWRLKSSGKRDILKRLQKEGAHRQ